MTKAWFYLFVVSYLLMTTWPFNAQALEAEAATNRPNIIFVVADDMGWRDTGYSGNTIAKTPNLDEMASVGLRFENFFSAHGTCSPGRMAILTGRTPLRAKMVTTVGPMQAGEVTVAQVLKSAGYQTGHFGKWGVGTGETHPLKVGFDEALWSKGFYENNAMFFVGQNREKTLKLNGESSVATMKLAVQFIEKRAERNQPFFVQISFGSPHGPHVAAEEFKQLYPDLPEKDQHFWGEISGLDAAVGLLRREIRRLKIANNTLLWFVSDNGGISEESGIERKGRIGSRTIGLLEWPAKLPEPMSTGIPVCHTDMYPTILDIVGVKMQYQPVIDGVSILPLIEGKMEHRPKPLGFTSGRYADKEDLTKCEVLTGVWIDRRYMLRVVPPDKRRKEERVTLHDIFADPAQEHDLAGKHPEKVKAMLKELEQWRETVKESFAGKDYHGFE